MPHANKLTGNLHVNSAALSFTFLVIYAVRPSHFLWNVSCRPQAPLLFRLKVSLAAWLAVSLELILFLVVGIVLTIVAAIITSFRLCIRARQKRLWINDAWAALGMIFNFTLLIVDFLYLQDYSECLRGVYVAYILLKKRRKIPSRHKGSIILYVCSLSSYTRDITNTTSGLPNPFTQLYGKILSL
jgi:hypothetical protein